MDEVEKILLQDPDIDTMFLSVGAGISFRGSVGGAQANSGAANIHLKENRTASTDEIAKRIEESLKGISGIRATASPFDLVSNIIGGNSQGLEVNVFGTDLEYIANAANQVKDALTDIPGLEGVDVNFEEATPEISWTVDRQKAQALGVSYQEIASAINSSTNGTLSTYFQDDGFQYPIYVQIPDDQRNTLEDLVNLPIKKHPVTGNQILLGQVANPIMSGGPDDIQRINRRRYISVGGRYGDERPESQILADVEERMKSVELPPGITWEFGERQVRKAQEFSGLGLAVVLAIALIYMLLASQFESFIYPLVVLTTVPLCVIGVVLSLFLSGRAFGLTAFIGILMLVGIVVKNGILLVEYTNQLRGRGIPRDEAILIASPTRLRPILMTSIASVLGMLPLAVATGSASALQAPLATVVIGGLTTSTILTLFVVPVVYTFFDDLGRKFRGENRDLAAAESIEPTPSSVGHSDVSTVDDPQLTK